MSTDYFSESSSRMNYWYSDGNSVPEIISFTQLLKWNYANDYAAFIRYAYKTGSLTINYDAFYGMETLPEITEVCIVEGIYDRMSRLSFSMKVVCGILFTDRASGEQFTQKVCVEGFHEFDDYTAKYKRRNSSNYFMGITEYDNRVKTRSRSRLDEYLVPIMNKRDFDKYAYNLLEMYYPEALEEVFRNDLLEKFNLSHQMKSETYMLCQIMTATKPDISVHEINQYLASIGKKTWTKSELNGELPQVG